MLTIDGSMGEGGGQVLRSSLALSLLTGTPIAVDNIRAGRARPGLMRQHLAAVHAAAAIGAATTVGAELGSKRLEFHPRGVRAGDHTFATGGAGSTTLVLQTVLLPLLLATDGPSTLRFEGGTHNPMAPPYDFLTSALAPLLARMGARLAFTFGRHGFYPTGGGAWSVSIQPSKLGGLELLHRGAIRARAARAIVAQVPPSVALRELEALNRALGWEPAAGKPLVLKDAPGPGNALVVTVESEHVTEVFTAFGERGLRAERVAETAAQEVQRYLDVGVPVGAHLADQLLLPLALGGGGTFRTVAPSGHTTTQIALLEAFIGAQVTAHEESQDAWRIDVRAARRT